jgi:hypothetical protein
MVQRERVWIILATIIVLVIAFSAFQLYIAPEELSQDLRDQIINKVADEPGWETFFRSARVYGNTFTVRFYHDSQEPQPIWIEGDIEYTLSTDLAEANEEVTLSVTLVDNQVPSFRLHVGRESEIFEFKGAAGQHEWETSSTTSNGTQQANSLGIKLTVPSTTHQVYVPGVGASNVGQLSPNTWTNPTHYYISSWLVDNLYGLAHAYQNFVSIGFNKTSDNHTLILSQNISNSQTFLVFSKGSWEKMDRGMALIESGEFMNKITPTFGFGLGTVYSIKMLLPYTDLDMGSTLRINPSSGTQKVLFKYNHTLNQKPVIVEKRI